MTSHRDLPKLNLVPVLAVVFSLLLPLSGSGLSSFTATQALDKPSIIPQEVRYRCPKASEVRLVWGINNWKTVPEEDRPSGTYIRRSVMQTPMTHMDDYFSITVHVPLGAILDYGFLITGLGKNGDVRIWDANGSDSLHKEIVQNGYIEINSTTEVLQSSKAPRERWRWLPQLIVVLTCPAITLWCGLFLLQKRREWEQRSSLQSFGARTVLSRWSKAGTVCLSLLIGIASAEMILQVSNYYDALGAARELDSLKKGRDQMEKTMRVDRYLGLRPRLNFGEYNEYGTKTNDYNFVKASATARQIVLGSKPAFQFVEELKRTSPEGVEVWNGGVESFGTVQAILFYSQYQYRTKPDQIVLLINPSDVETAPISYLDNKNNVMAFLPYVPSSSLNHFLFIRSRVYRLVIGILTIFVNSEHQVLAEIHSKLVSLGRSLAIEGTDLLIVVMPLLYPEDLWSASEKDRYAALMKMVSLTHLKYVDLLPAFRLALNHQVPIHQEVANPFKPSTLLTELFVTYIRDHSHTSSRDKTNSMKQ